MTGAKVPTHPKYVLLIANLYDISPVLSYDVEDVYKVIEVFDRSNVAMADLVRYFAKQVREQRYHDYEGILITDDTISKLKSMIV